ncbi:prolyl oligopeptidase family serine peptidase [Gimesia panareensis]|uniref:Prolyl oligopeptidase family protein n=1 Tax=Gimesia panareensis TaxID=2527978 RepID=A0A518AB42_9PLAN|nr:prolyl oligopeptidase family serine peptidase [Gimesia panareensis]QDT29084.1 Prolyl oligopeptidase family protein [Gimesia panareensis]QDU51936.1 Prolyl oligopeptidase family protein [Gimesia panareensis]
MSEPVSITCPHCAAAFKIKTRAAFGKKVKCPKCAVPFVIEKPASKSSAPRKQRAGSSRRRDDFSFDDADEESLFEEEDATYWEDDLNDGPAVRPARRQVKQPQKPAKKWSNPLPGIFASIKEYGFTPYMLLINFCLLSAYGYYFFLTDDPDTTVKILFINLGFAALCLAYFRVTVTILAVQAGILQFLLCFFVPFYPMFFALLCYEESKEALKAWLSAVCVFLLIGLSLYVYGPIVRKPQQAQAQERVLKPDPDGGRELKDLKKFQISHHTPLTLKWAEQDQAEENMFQEQKTASIGRMFEVTSTPAPGQEDAPTSQMKIRVFLPRTNEKSPRFPCVIVPPAGATLLTGMDIDAVEDIPNPEHEPYIKAGFAVITFSIDGDLGEGDQTSNADFIKAHQAFRKSKAGMLNYAQALSLALETIPEIDTDNIFLAGHSSAATLNLLFAEHAQQSFWGAGVIKGCLAYAPSVDPQRFFADHLAEIKPLIPDVEDFIRLSSPLEHYESIDCPVFLFHARGDQVTSFAATKQFAELLKSKGKDVELVSSDGVDHYQTMIDEGIPRGIQWIQARIRQPSRKPDLSPEHDQRIAEMKQAAQQRVEQNRPKKRSFEFDRSEPPQIGKMHESDLKMHGRMRRGTRRATFKIAGFDKEFEQKLKNRAAFELGALESAIDGRILGFEGENVVINLNQMTLSFDFTERIPGDFREKLAENKNTRVIRLTDDAPKNEPTDPNFTKVNPNIDLMTFRIDRIFSNSFDPIAAERTVEQSLRQIPEYVADSLVINYDDKWAAFKFKAHARKFGMAMRASGALARASIRVTPEWIKLSEDDLALADHAGKPGSTSSQTSTGTMQPAATAKQKYVIRYGVYGGDDVTDSARRCLKGFVWVDQETIHFNPDRKEITFVNRSPVDHSALERALKRNKFYQLHITREPVPSSAAEKTPVKAGAGTE